MKRTILISILIVFGSLTNFPGQIENPQSDAHGFDAQSVMRANNSAEIIEGDVLVLYLEEVKETTANPGIEQFFYDNNTNEPFGEDNAEKKSDTQKRDIQQEPIRLQTKLKYIESILKKAAIEPYSINGQIEGLRIKGLDKMFQAKALQLKSGDIIIAVNGYTLSSQRKAYDIFKKARKEPMMTVDLLRDGKTKQLLFDFQG